MTAVYDRIGVGYGELRRPDPRVAALIAGALGDARSVVNVGAGTGSYEPSGCVAVEPSRVMIEQRPGGSAPAVQAVAERLPFRAASFDAALAVLTTHHWSDVPRGLGELARVSSRQVVLTWDQRICAEFWLVRDYLPQIAEREASLPALDAVTACWPEAEVLAVPVPWDCQDGFLAAYWRRPEAYLRTEVRAAISAFAPLDDGVLTPALERLERELASGAWSRRNGALLEREELDCGYRLVIRGAVQPRGGT